MQPRVDGKEQKRGALLWAARPLAIAFGARVAKGIPMMKKHEKSGKMLKNQKTLEGKKKCRILKLQVIPERAIKKHTSEVLGIYIYIYI